MAIFEKKQCSICGKDIGFLGNHKLADGNLCKECSGKLSPWFSGIRKATVEDIRRQLNYREKNRAAVLALKPTKVLGDDVKIYLDEEAGKFVVTRSGSWRDANPDVISLSQVLRCVLEIDEDKDEIMDRDADGRQVSFDPPRYEYEYQFNIDMDIDSPYFNKLKVELSRFSDRPKDKDSQQYRELEREGREICALLTGKEPEVCAPETPAAAPEPEAPAAAQPVVVLAPDFNVPWTCSCGYEAIGNFCANCGLARPKKWFCPDCGKENNGLFCIGCGRRRPE